MTPDNNVRLGIAGQLTKAFITSPLTPLFLFAALVVGLVALVTGLVSFCPLYAVLGINTCPMKKG